jgi:Galactose oxidase, central domain
LKLTNLIFNFLKLILTFQFLEECRWEQEKKYSPTEEQPQPRAQHVALATQKYDRVFIYGGHASPTQRLNDCWWLKVSDYSWTRCLGDKTVSAN